MVKVLRQSLAATVVAIIGCKPSGYCSVEVGWKLCCYSLYFGIGSGDENDISIVKIDSFERRKADSVITLSEMRRQLAQRTGQEAAGRKSDCLPLCGFKRLMTEKSIAAGRGVHSLTRQAFGGQRDKGAKIKQTVG